MRGWTSSSKNPECPPERTRTKEESCLEISKRKLKQAALEWDDLDIQAELKSFMCFDLSLRVDAKKEKLIDELNFKKCMQLKISLKSKLFVGITNKQRKYIIHPDFMVANQEITDRFIQNIKSNPNKVHDLTGEMKKSFKNRDWKQVSTHKYTKSHAALTIMVKLNTLEGYMQSIMLHLNQVGFVKILSSVNQNYTTK